MRAIGLARVLRYLAEDFSTLVRLRRLRVAGKHRKPALLH